MQKILFDCYKDVVVQVGPWKDFKPFKTLEFQIPPDDRVLLPWTSNFLFPWITALTEEAAGYEVASNTPGPSWALFFSSKLCYKSCLDKKLSNMILLLQFVTQYFETWSKPVDIFKKIVRVQHIPILMLPLRTQCCVWGTSYLNEKNCPPKYSHIFPQHWNGEGGRLASESCWIIVSKIF